MSRIIVTLTNFIESARRQTAEKLTFSSTVFTIKLTDKINMRIFYDHIVRAASASDNR